MALIKELRTKVKEPERDVRSEAVWKAGLDAITGVTTAAMLTMNDT